MSSVSPTDVNQQSLARGSVNVQIFTQFKYNEKYVHIYDAKSNIPTDPRQWKFFYVPIMQPANSPWVWTIEKRIRMDLIVGSDVIGEQARNAIKRKYDEILVGNYSQSWDVIPLLIDSLFIYCKEVRLNLDLYKHVWSTDDFKPDQLNSELNKQFTLDKKMSEKKKYSKNDYKINQYNKSSEEAKGSVGGLLGFAKSFVAGIMMKFSSTNDKTNITNIVLSDTDIQNALSENGVHGEWKGKKFFAKSFNVYRLTDILDHMQTAISSTELKADKKRGAIFRTISSLDKVAALPVGLFTGEIRMYTSTNVVPPYNWLRCDGSEVSRTTYARLFEEIGTAYGSGDNVTTFQLPDFRGRFPLGLDGDQNRTALASRLGDMGGQEKHRLTVEQLPTHAHDQGSFIIHANGSHTHAIPDATVTYSMVNFLDNNNTQSFHLILVNKS